jgi:hypothetical protein
MKRKTVDNIDIILPLLEFKSEDSFYYLQILQRKKENPHLGSNSRVIKNYYITSKEQLLKRYDEIKTLCKVFNARASIRLNVRSFEKVAYGMLANTAKLISDRNFSPLRSCYDRSVGLHHDETNNKKWILDLDMDYSEKDIMLMKGVIRNAMPEGDKLICYIPSKSGYHLITKPFDSREFKKLFPEVEIHKDNPTNLYIY